MGRNRSINLNAITRMGKLLIGASIFTVVGFTGTLLNLMDTIDTGKSSKCTLVEIHERKSRNVLDISCEGLQKSQNYLYIARDEKNICRIAEDGKIECIEIPIAECKFGGSFGIKSSRRRFSVEDDAILAYFDGSGTGGIMEVRNGKIMQHCTNMLFLTERFGNIFVEVDGGIYRTYNLRTQQLRQRRLTKEHYSSYSDSVHEDSNGRIWTTLKTDSEFLLYGDSDDKPTTIDIKKKFEELCGKNCSKASLFGNFHKDSFQVVSWEHSPMICNLITESCSIEQFPIEDTTETPEEDVIRNEIRDLRLQDYALHPKSGKEYRVIQLGNTSPEPLDIMWAQMSKDYGCVRFSPRWNPDFKHVRNEISLI